jgi:hypothetical protein
MRNHLFIPVRHLLLARQWNPVRLMFQVIALLWIVSGMSTSFTDTMPTVTGAAGMVLVNTRPDG